ncbi:IDEAL domain-containing protein [Bacillus sp. SCS-151]|uniref:IDEAL domain-containing protein n=1 Tax=Nanhaiella sioensis TaxID=3115293 RepID=UPI00397CF5EC
MKPLLIGDWVKGTSRNDELFHGFIESLEGQTGIVRIVQSDNHELEGQSIKMPITTISIIQHSDLQQEGYLLNLIDIALIERDEETFMKLTKKLNAIRKNNKELVRVKNATTAVSDRELNRQ